MAIVHGVTCFLLKTPRHVRIEHYHFKRASETPTHETRKRQAIIQFSPIQNTIETCDDDFIYGIGSREYFFGDEVRQEEVQDDVKPSTKFILLIPTIIQLVGMKSQFSGENNFHFPPVNCFAENSESRKHAERSS